MVRFLLISIFVHSNIKFIDNDVSAIIPFSSEPDLKRKRTTCSPAARSASSSSNDSENGDPGVELTVKDSFFKPLYIIGEREEPSTRTKRLTVVLVLPSGVNRSDFTLQVLEGGMSLQLTVKWPNPLVDLQLLHQKWLKPVESDQTTVFTMFHPKVLSLENALKKKRQRAADDVVSTARILLPFPVQTHIESKTNLGFKESGTKLVYIEPKAMAENYAVANDNDEFEEYSTSNNKEILFLWSFPLSPVLRTT